MKQNFTAVVKLDGAWWIGWVEEVPGVNCQERCTNSNGLYCSEDSTSCTSCGCHHKVIHGFELTKAGFWHRWAGRPMNKRQIYFLNRPLDGFEGKLTSSKWAAIAKCSPDTALRDINELLALGILAKMPEGGHSTAYELSID